MRVRRHNCCSGHDDSFLNIIMIFSRYYYQCPKWVAGYPFQHPKKTRVPIWAYRRLTDRVSFGRPLPGRHCLARLSPVRWHRLEWCFSAPSEAPASSSVGSHPARTCSSNVMQTSLHCGLLLSTTTTTTTIIMALWTLSGTNRVKRYQKGKTNLDLLEQEIVSGSGIGWAICKSALHPDI